MLDFFDRLRELFGGTIVKVVCTRHGGRIFKPAFL